MTPSKPITPGAERRRQCAGGYPGICTKDANPTPKNGAWCTECNGKRIEKIDRQLKELLKGFDND